MAFKNQDTLNKEEAAFKYVEALRSAILSLHTTLLEYQKIKYVSTIGPLGTSGNLLSLVINHPSFAWLRQLSELIVSIDEMLENNELLTTERTEDLKLYIKNLLTVSESSVSFQQQYSEAILKDPGVALAHAKVHQLLKLPISS